MSQNSGHTAEQSAHSGDHIIPVSTYIAVFAALLVGTALTTGVAFIDLGAFNTVAALAIAVCKMLLVIFFFMHVKYQKGLTRIAIVCAFFWLGIMMTFTLSDELTRTWEINPLPWNGVLLFFTHLLK